MREDFDKVIALINHLELNPDVDQYKWRFILQKVTFLAQALGVNIDYAFTPYVAGPYSSSLAHDYYTYRDELSSRRTSYILNETEIQSIEKISEYCDLEGDLSLLESTSTFVYIISQESGSDDDDINIRFRVLKPYISDTKRIIGMTQAKQLLFREEYLTEELKKEMDIWDTIE